MSYVRPANENSTLANSKLHHTTNNRNLCINSNHTTNNRNPSINKDLHHASDVITTAEAVEADALKPASPRCAAASFARRDASAVLIAASAQRSAARRYEVMNMP